MANLDLSELQQIDGFIAACLVDHTSSMMLGSVGSGFDLEVAAAGNTQVIKAKMKVMNALKLNDTIEDILISLGTQYHLIRPLGKSAELFLYVALDRDKANLAMARHEVRSVEKSLEI